uniref:Zgc:112416 n=1 Tax=Sparus aurata TaxID=8175 RepID=A0A671WN18_SPAAU
KVEEIFFCRHDCVCSGSYDGQFDQLHRALRRKQHLLRRLMEQHMLEDLHRPHTWGGSRKQDRSHYFMAPQPPPPLPFYQPTPVLPPPPEPPRIIQQTLPQQPATIIQQLPQQQPLITQIPPPQPYPAPRSGSIKEDMVEMMLMQNAQMHQIIMQNMMLRAMPPLGLSPPGGPSHYAPPKAYLGQVHTNTHSLGTAVHHHHHYGSNPAAQQLPPIIGHPTWIPGMQSVPAGQAGGQLPSIHHVTAPFTLPQLHTLMLYRLSYPGSG